ncbi:MAG: NADH-quinone oxidoreductase subunit A [Opitutales bacterium]|jgi:NADH-quinone oxidoreductase subunit A
MMTQAATTPEAFAPVLVQIVLALSIAVGLILVSHIFGQRARVKNKYKDTPYECGLPMRGPAHPRFSVKFYLAAMLFILFDIEVVFLFPLAVVYRKLLSIGVPILPPLLAFLFVLVVGLVYELKKGALEWDR